MQEERGGGGGEALVCIPPLLQQSTPQLFGLEPKCVKTCGGRGTLTAAKIFKAQICHRALSREQNLA